MCGGCAIGWVSSGIFTIRRSELMIFCVAGKRGIAGGIECAASGMLLFSPVGLAQQPLIIQTEMPGDGVR